MDQSTSGKRPSAVFARRLVQRAMVVIGGAAAATALAWWLSSTSAAAETQVPPLPPAPQVPVVSELLAPVNNTLTSVTDQLRAQPPLDESLRDLGAGFEQAAADVGKQAQEQWNNCTVCDLGPLDELGRPAPGDDGGRLDIPNGPAAEHGARGSVLPVAGPVADTGVDADVLAEDGAVDRAYADGGPRRGSPAPVPPMPGFPTWPVPAATAPANSQSGQNGPGFVDGVLFAALPWSDQFADLTVVRSLTATQATPAGRPGAQPGVSPD